MMRPDTGKLILPGSKFHWDIHYSQAGEEITSTVELGIYFYPKGQEPKYRKTLQLVPAALGRSTSAEHGDGRRRASPCFASTRGSRASSRTCTCAARRCRWKRFCRPARRRCISHVNDFNFNWHNTYVYADDAAPLLPKGTIMNVTAWHDNTAAKKSNPGPESVGGLGRSHR